MPKPPKKPAPPSEALRHSPFAALAGARAPEAAPPTDTPAPPIEAAPELPSKLRGKLTVRRETKGRGGKTITRVSGLPADRLEELAGRMKRALGCGALVEGEDVLLLGALVPRAAAFLRAEGAKQVVEGN